MQLDDLAIERRRALRLQALELLPLEVELFLLQAVLGEHRLVRIDDDDAMRAVDDQPLVFADQAAAVMHRDDRGNAEALGDDRRVRRRAAQVGQERGERMLLVADHVGG